MADHDPEFLRRAHEARSRVVELTPAQVDHLRQRGAVLIDVRSPAEFADGHLEGALSLDLGYRSVHSIAGGLRAVNEASTLDGHP